MIYLTTGANGTGKTLFTLKEVREKQLKENRPVYHNGRFELSSEGDGFGWKKIDFKDWESCPDGAIFLIDECHNDMPKISSGAQVPAHIMALGEHRRRGFDFYLITQHPQNISTFVRKIVGSPGWHRHLKRNFGADLVSQLEWNYVNDQCEKPGAGKTGQVVMRPFPKEVYAWYNSALLHTGKKRIPKQVYMLAALAVIVPLLGFFAYRQVMKPVEVAKPAEAASGAVPGAPGQSGAGAPAASRFMTKFEYFNIRVPRINGLPATAPVYDKLTEPTEAPYPAACLQSGPVCRCYTQQGTVLDTPDDICKNIVHRGYFMDWKPRSLEALDRREEQKYLNDSGRKPQASQPVQAAPAASGFSSGPLQGGNMSALVVPALVADNSPRPTAADRRDEEMREFMQRQRSFK